MQLFQQQVEKEWERVKEFFEVAYHMKFKQRPSDEQIHMLYRKMLQIAEDEKAHRERLKARAKAT